VAPFYTFYICGICRNLSFTHHFDGPRDLLFLGAFCVVTGLAAYGYRTCILWMDTFSVGAFACARDLFEACIPAGRQAVTNFSGASIRLSIS
jgi:hypothetical protein